MADPTVLIVQVVALGACLWGESLVPLFLRERGERVPHDARNVSIGLVNGLVLTLGFSGLVAAASRWGGVHAFGLVQWLRLPTGVEGVIGFLAFDGWMYGWHRANHAIPWLWRFHRVHHSDPTVDVTSALRFHVGEMVISTLLRLAVIPLLGISLGNLVFYELCLQPVIYFHHSNVAMPERWDRLMRWLLVSPNMHRVHHSDVPVETNSNYASILSFWDRLGGTYRLRDLATIRYGLKEFREPRWHTLRGIMMTPCA